MDDNQLHQNDAYEHDPYADEPLQFSLSQAFGLLTLASVYFAIVRATGVFLAALVLGFVLLIVVLQFFKTTNLLWGAIVGAVAASIILVGCGLLCGRIYSLEFVLSACLVPSGGYVLGMLFAAHEASRVGI